jgi:microcystin-dependent protein
MAIPFIGEIKVTPWNVLPKGWAFCDGQLVAVNQNPILFGLLGTTYGGDGEKNFALPDFRGRAPMHVGEGRALGQAGGEEFHTLVAAELPAHNHTVNASTQVGTTNMPASSFLANSNTSPYRTDCDTTLAPLQAISNTGNSEPHENRQPFLVLNFMIATAGAGPSPS